MKQKVRITLCAALVTLGICNAGAASTDELMKSIEETRTKQEQAHQIAEYVRSFGEDDSNPAIQFAQKKWAEQNELLIDLYEQYNTAEKAEAIAKELAAEEQAQREQGTYLGRFRISHYCPCTACNGSSSYTASGTPVTPWTTAAVDPGVIPLGSTFRIEGYGTFQAQDTGGAIRNNRIDICVGSHAEAMRLGVVYRDVYIM